MVCCNIANGCIPDVVVAKESYLNVCHCGVSESNKYIHLSCLLFSLLYSSLPAHSTTEEQSPVEAKGEEKEEEVEVDVVGVYPVPGLLFDERKVGAIMVECSHHVNLVRVPAEKSDPLLERVLGEVGHRQQELLSQDPRGRPSGQTCLYQRE